MADSVIANLIAKLSLDSSNFEKETEAAAKKLNAITKENANGKLAEYAQKAGKGMLVAGGAIASAAAITTHAAMDFESAFTGVRKTIDFAGSSSEAEAFFSGMRDRILDLSEIMPVAAEDIAGVYAAAGQLGIQNDNLDNFAETVIGLASATDLTTDSAAMMMAQFANITGMDQTVFSNMGSVITALGNNTATTESAILDMSMGMSAAGAQSGMSTEQILGWAAAMSSAGLETAAAGTAFSRLVTQMGTSVATGDSYLSEFARISGMSSEDFAQAWEKDASGALRAFIEGFGQLDVGAMSDSLAVLEIGEMREIDMLKRLGLNTDNLSLSLGVASEAWVENAALTTEVATRNADAASQMAMLKNQLSRLAIEAGSALLPALRGIMQQITPVVQKFTAFAEQHPQIIIGLAGIGLGLASVGGALTTVFSFISKAQAAVNVIRGLGIAAKLSSFGSSIAGIGSTLAGFMTAALPVVAVIAAIAAAIVGLKVAYDHNFLGIRDTLAPAVDAVKGYMGDLAAAFQAGGFSGVFQKIGDDISGLWSGTVAPKLAEIEAEIQGFMSSLFSDPGGTIAAGISGLWDSVSGPVKDIGTKIADGIHEAVSVAFGAVKGWGEIFSGFVSSVTSFFDGLDLSGIGTKIADGIREAVASALGTAEGWGEVFSGFVSSVMSFFDGLDLSGIGTKIADKVKESVTNAFSGMGDWFSQTFSGMGDWFGGLFGGGGEEQTGLPSGFLGSLGFGESPAEGGRRRVSKTDDVIAKMSAERGGGEMEAMSPMGALQLLTQPVSDAAIASWYMLAEAVKAALAAFMPEDGAGGGMAASVTGESAGAAGAASPVAIFTSLASCLERMVAATSALIPLWGSELPAAAITLANALGSGKEKKDGSMEDASKGGTLMSALKIVAATLDNMVSAAGSLVGYWGAQLPAAAKKLMEACSQAQGVCIAAASAASAAAGTYMEWAAAIWEVVAALSALAAISGGGSDTGGSNTTGKPAGSGSGLQFAATGAEVWANDTFIVGEEGPELFVPRHHGYIIPNDEAFGGRGQQITVQFNGDVIGDEQSITDYVTKACLSTMERELRYA